MGVNRGLIRRRIWFWFLTGLVVFVVIGLGGSFTAFFVK